MQDEYLAKTIAVNYISMQTGFGRYVVEKTLNQLQAEGRIKLLSTPYARTIHISREDVELVINILTHKAE